ncbi:hypothetical protein CD790_12090 [Streptomyces sp. SAJ15]|nr:hypothetical protein CD790_12090 [Streptomyces sp. SAJ15]
MGRDPDAPSAEPAVRRPGPDDAAVVSATDARAEAPARDRAGGPAASPACMASDIAHPRSSGRPQISVDPSTTVPRSTAAVRSCG